MCHAAGAGELAWGAARVRRAKLDMGSRRADAADHTQVSTLGQRCSPQRDGPASRSYELHRGQTSAKTLPVGPALGLSRQLK